MSRFICRRCGKTFEHDNMLLLHLMPLHNKTLCKPLKEDIDVKELINDIQTYLKYKDQHRIALDTINTFLDKTSLPPQDHVISLEQDKSNEGLNPYHLSFKFKFYTLNGIKEFSCIELSELIYDILIMYDELFSDKIQCEKTFDIFFETIILNCCINLDIYIPKIVSIDELLTQIHVDKH